MKQLLILSGKGGTGKTTLASAFIILAKAKVYADCDIDAPNLHLSLKHKGIPKRTDFFGMPKAKLDKNICVQCGLCRQHCRFNAIDTEYVIDPFSCEGCGVCVKLCPAEAVVLVPSLAGELMLYTDEALFSTARLRMGSGTSGKLVTEVKKQMQSRVVSAELAVIDGSPGIGCPVIASLNGADMVLIVAEPSVSGISDLTRIIQTADRFEIPVAVCINKYDINTANTEKIQSFCHQHEIDVVGRIPFDHQVVKALNHGANIIEIDCPATYAIKDVFSQTCRILNV